MKIWLLSDLHLEYEDLREPLLVPDADVCVLAGDLCRSPASGVHWLAKHILPSMPVVYVAGNHEFYGGSVKEGIADGLAAAAKFPGVHFLNDASVEIGGVRFIGATLWTDFRIEGNRELAMYSAGLGMSDYRQIARQLKPKWLRFTTTDSLRLHQRSRAFIERELQPDFRKTVVVTHHLPHAKSVPPRFTGDLLNAAYASDLSSQIETGRPDLWLHGHTHDSCDYRVGDTRIVCNPRGYNDENTGFDSQLVLEV